MRRPQFSLRGLLLFTALLAAVCAAARLIPYDAWNLIGALGCTTAGTVIVFVVPALLPTAEGRLRGLSLLLGVVLILLGIAATLTAGSWFLIRRFDFTWFG